MDYSQDELNWVSHNSYEDEKMFFPEIYLENSLIKHLSNKFGMSKLDKNYETVLNSLYSDINYECSILIKNPSKEMIKSIIRGFEQDTYYNESEDLIHNIKVYIKNLIKYKYYIGHTEAYLFLDEELSIHKPKNKITSLKLLKGDVSKLHKSLIEHSILYSDYPLKSFIKIFSECELKEIERIKNLERTNTKLIYLFDKMDTLNFIDLNKLPSVDKFLAYLLNTKPSSISSSRQQMLSIKSSSTYNIIDEIIKNI